MVQKRILDWLVYLAVRLVICLLQALSLQMCYAFARLLGTFAYKVNGRHRGVTFENLRQAFPGRYSDVQLERMVRAVYMHFASIISEIAHIPRRLRATTCKDYFRFRDPGRLVQCMMTDRPVILMTAHFGNWELAGYAMAVFGFKPYSVARSLDNPYLERLLRSFRTRTGQEIIYKRGAFDQVSAVMAQRRVVGFLPDQDAGHRGVFVDFFGRPASTHKGVALLSLQHDAPICVGFARRVARGFQYEVWVEDIVDPRQYKQAADPVWSITQDCTRAIERAVRLAPEQYLWLHRRWKHQPPAQPVPQAA
jgi:KDO2-lipid IV(A) lauroyltransferase